MNFRLTKLKVIISIIAIVGWYFIMALTGSDTVCEMLCSQSFSYNNCPMSVPLFQHSGCCSCPVTIPSDEMLVLILVLLIPGILTYLIWSFLQKKKK